MEDLSVVIDGLKIFYKTAGNKNNPVVVFLHAWGAHVDWLSPVVVALSQHFYVIAPEHPGLLRSDTPQGDASFIWRAALLHSFLHTLQVTEAFNLVGNSFGGGVATAYTLSYPERVQNLILVDALPSKEYPTTPLVRVNHFLYGHTISCRLLPLILRKYLIHTYIGTPVAMLSPSEVERKVQMLATRTELTADYTKLSVPVFLIWGTKDRLIHPIAYARKIVKLLPQGTLIEYSGSAPTIYKQPHKVVPLIEQVISL